MTDVVTKESFNELQADIERLKRELSERDGELPLALSVFYRGSVVLGNVGLIGAGCFGFVTAIVVALLSSAVMPIGALNVVAAMALFLSTWTVISWVLVRGAARLTRQGLRKVLASGASHAPLAALAVGGSTTPVPSAGPVTQVPHTKSL